jgi:hypothetical protein
MKYDNGGLTANNRGSLGGVTFSRSKSGNYARIKGYGTNPNSSGQLSQRQKTALISQAWRLLNANVQSDFAALALQYPRINSLGQTYYYSGFQMYMHLSLNLPFPSESPLLACPNISQNSFPSITNAYGDVALTPGSKDIQFIFTGTLTANEYLMIQSSGGVSKGLSNCYNYRTISKYLPSFVSGTSIMTDYLNVFGNLPNINQNVWFRWWLVKKDYGFQSSKLKSKAVPYV